MAVRFSAAAACVLLGLLSGRPLVAQQQADATGAATPVDPGKLPLNLQKLQKKFQEAVEREQRNGPTLRYTVDVFAQAPRIQLFFPDDKLQFTPAPYGAPTHQDMINIVTPQEFRSPIMDFGALIRSIPKSPKEKK